MLYDALDLITDYGLSILAAQSKIVRNNILEILSVPQEVIYKAAELIGCKREQLDIIDAYNLNSDFQLSKINDFNRGITIIDTFDILDNAKSILMSRNYRMNYFRLLELKAKKIKFVGISFKIIYSDSPLKFYIVKKGDLFRIVKSFNKYIEFYKVNKPILETGVLDNIINNSINFLCNYRIIKELGCNVRRGILLYGPPGNGKTLITKYLKMLAVKKNKEVLNNTSNTIDVNYRNDCLSAIFNRSGLSFFDDIDISYLNRRCGDGKIACSILSAMTSNLQTGKAGVSIFTSNEDISDLDEAFLRPGRIDLKIYIGKPSERMKIEFFDTWPQQIKENIDYNDLLDNFKNCSFADLEELKNLLVLNYYDTKKWDLNKCINDFIKNSKLGDEIEKIGFSHA